MDVLGVKFNPNLHEALLHVDDPEKEPGTIAFVITDGYYQSSLN